MYQSLLEVETVWFGGCDFIFFWSSVPFTETIVITELLKILIHYVFISIYRCGGMQFIFAKEAIFGAGSSKEKEGAFGLEKAKHSATFLILNTFASIHKVIAYEIDINWSLIYFEFWV